MNHSDSNKFVAMLAIISVPFALGAFALAWSPADQFHNSDPQHDGYVQPRSVGDLVLTTQESTLLNLVVLFFVIELLNIFLKNSSLIN